MSHRVDAAIKFGQTESQLNGLKLGRQKGTNHRIGYKHRPESKLKASESHKKWCAENPDKIAIRGEKIRGEKHYRWNNGTTKLNKSIRQMTEHRKWMDSVKERDGYKCMECGSTENLESHHKIPLHEILIKNNITDRISARNCNELWDISNGITVCSKCHYKIHGRTYADR
jgi:ribosomal protein L37AE/L43A